MGSWSEPAEQVADVPPAVEDLDICIDPPTIKEVKAAVKVMKSGKTQSEHGKGKVCPQSQLGEPSGSVFCSMKRLGVFLLPPGWDTSPSQVTSQYFVRLHCL